MPETNAKRGDIYLVSTYALLNPTRDQKPARPMVCVAELPTDPEGWKAMPRVTTSPSSNDLLSKADPAIGLTRDGWWTYRFLHTVKKERTGKTGCRYKGALVEPERTRVLNFYKSR